MKKIKAVKILGDNEEIFLRTIEGGLIPSLGGAITYDSKFLSDFDTEDIEIEVGIFDKLPKIEGEFASKTDSFLEV